jgi:hypothetical protein
MFDVQQKVDEWEGEMGLDGERRELIGWGWLAVQLSWTSNP